MGSSIPIKTVSFDPEKGMRANHVISWAAFASLLILSVGIAFLYLYNIYEWRNYPDFGFGYRTATGIERVGIVTPNGRASGLEEGDLILLVNGRHYNTLAEFRAAQGRNLGDTNTYLIERGRQFFEIAITNVPIGFGGSFERSGYLWLLGLCYLFIGSIVFLMKSHEKSSWIFFFLMVIFGLFITFLYKTGKMEPGFLEQVNIFLYATAPAALFHFALTFPSERTIVRKHPWMLAVPYFVSAVLFLLVLSATPFVTDVPPLLRRALVVYMAVSMLYFVGSHADHVYRSPSEISRARAKMVLLGFVLTALIPLADFFVSGVFNVYVLPGFSYYLPFMIFFPLSIGYSIVRHNLFDFDAIIRRTYGYVLTTGTIVVFYGAFVLLSNYAFGQFDFTHTPAFQIAFILFIVFFFNPIRDRVQTITDRVFFRLEYNYQETVERISDLFRSLQKTDEVVKTMMDTVMGTMFIDSGAILLLNRSHGSYECHVRDDRPDILPFSNGKDGPADDGLGRLVGCDEDVANVKIPGDEPLIKKIEAGKREVTIYDVEEDPRYAEVRESGREIFRQLKATVIVPLIYENKLTGFMALGRKKSGKFYRRGDINLLNTLANQGAVAVENSVRLGEVIEKERMDEELSIARDLQMSMLPAVIPEIAGFRVAAHCTPAREVGGDFYDFIADDGSQLGIIVGDVTGKGVSGALVMSASRSVFRMLSEQGLGVGQLMTRANDRAKKDIREGMFVAVLYAVLHGEDRSVHLCSAGQTQPVLYSARTGRAGFVETVGDNCPLGIIDGVEYEETILALEEGDCLIFYTDGVVEAVNEKGEMFGFERLLEAVGSAGKGDAGSVLEALKGQVDGFVGKAPQHDDITIIVAAAGREP